jgi:hypothetical protein
VTSKCVLLTLAALLCAATCAVGQSFEMLTWTTPGAAPADGEPLAGSASFAMRSRLGGPFVGQADSPSFILWGCGAYTPVEGSFFATLASENGTAVVLRWVVDSTSGVEGFNVYRALSEEGPFDRLNDEPLPFETPGSYTDETVWPGTTFWYDLRAVMPDGSEEELNGGPAMVKTGGELVTGLRAASPNPFTSQTVLHHDIASVVGDARLVVYDVSGRVVRTFDVTPRHPGRYEVIWDGTNDNGQRVASGVYFCSLEAGGARNTRPVVLLR